MPRRTTADSTRTRMPRTTADSTRTAILDAAEELILRHGFAGTSVDAILERVSLSKGAFFHHFESKQALAYALVERFAQRDAELIDDALARAERLSRDPVQRVLLAVGLLEEMAAGLESPHPGCLLASCTYEAQQFDPRVHEVIRASFVYWNERLRPRLQAALDATEPRLATDAGDLADALVVVAEGAFILSRVMADPRALERQLRQYRNYLELLFGVV